MGGRFDLSQFRGGPIGVSPDDARPASARGRIASPPTSPIEGLTVALLNYDQSLTFDVAPGHWVRDGSNLPPQDGICLVSFDDFGDAWVTGWEPASG
jgi:hypothetical protein